ncbi:MAG TPA: hypothetical protein VJ972_08365, partial [Anaerolineales bacterium]|nr:hypothetical protein [Anaerolineales bacterium]
QGAVQTFLSPEEIGQIACLATQIEPQDLIFTSFPQQLFEQGRTYDPVFKKRVFTWDVDYDILREYIQQFNDGKWPYAVFVNQEQPEREAHLCQ